MHNTFVLTDFSSSKPPVVNACADIVLGTFEIASDLLASGSDHGAISALFYCWQLSLSKHADSTVRAQVIAAIAPTGVVLDDKNVFEIMVRHALRLAHRRDRTTLDRYVQCLEAFYAKFGNGDPVEFQKGIYAIRQIMRDECRRVLGWQ